jgi:hypothetical protein
VMVVDGEAGVIPAEMRNGASAATDQGDPNRRRGSVYRFAMSAFDMSDQMRDNAPARAQLTTAAHGRVGPVSCGNALINESLALLHTCFARSRCAVSSSSCWLWWRGLGVAPGYWVGSGGDRG